MSTYLGEILSRDDDFLGTPWVFLVTTRGRFWYHRISGKVLDSSSMWGKK